MTDRGRKHQSSSFFQDETEVDDRLRYEDGINDEEDEEERLAEENQNILLLSSMSEDEVSAHLSKALNEVGKGRFQLIASLLLGLGNAADAVELTSIGFILPQLSSISSAQKGFLSGGMFIGMLLGALIAGVTSDKWGRQPTLVIALALNSLFGALSGLSPSWYWLVSFRILSGLGVGGSTGLVFTLLAELLPVHRRGYYLTVVAWFWMLGSFYAAGIAWLLLDIVSWRWYALLAALPAAAGALLTFAYIPESPRHLVVKGKFTEALRELQVIAKINNKREALHSYLSLFRASPTINDDQSSSSSSSSASFSSSSFSSLDDANDKNQDTKSLLPHEDNEEIENVDGFRRTRSGKCNDYLVRFEKGIREVFQSLARLFEPQIRKSTILLSVVWWTLCYGWYGLTLWIPTIMDTLDLGMSIYGSSFFVVVANLPGNLISAVIVDRVGRKNLLSVSMGIAGVAALAFAFADSLGSAIFTLCLAMVFNCFGTMGWNALDCISAELFPTQLRNTGLGFATACGRLGSLTSQIVNGFLIQASLPLMLVIISVNVLLGCLCTLFLTESANTQLSDFIDEPTLATDSSDSLQTSETSEDPY